MPLRYIPALIIFIGLLGAGSYSYKVESSYIKGMKTITGELVALGSRSVSSRRINDDEGKVNIHNHEGGSNTQALVDFEFNNTTFRVEGRAMGYPRWKLGQKVEVYFSESNPSEARINRWDEVYFFTLISSFFIIFCLVFSIINFVVYKVRGRPLS